jgi:hypothetical protein
MFFAFYIEWKLSYDATDRSSLESLRIRYMEVEREAKSAEFVIIGLKDDWKPTEIYSEEVLVRLDKILDEFCRNF